MNTTKSIVCKQTTLPRLVIAIILQVGFGIVWIFGLVGTDYDVVGVPSVATQYIFGILLMFHAVLVFVLSLVYRSAKYEIGEVLPKQNGSQAIGLEFSGKFSHEESIKKKSLDSEHNEELIFVRLW